MTKTKPTTLPSAIGTLFAALMLVLGAALLAGLVVIDTPLPSLESAVSADATIVGNRIQPGEWSRGKFPTKSADRYYVQISFVSAGNEVQSKEVEVGQAYYTAHLPGGQVTVWYFPERPRVSVLDRAKLVEAGSHYGMLLGGVLGVLGICMGVHFGNRLFIARRGYSLL